MLLAQPAVALAASDRLMEMLLEDVVCFMPEVFESFNGKKTHVSGALPSGQGFSTNPSLTIVASPLYDGRDAPCPRNSHAHLGHPAEAGRELALAITARKAIFVNWMYSTPPSMTV